MTIVTMSKLRVIAPQNVRRPLLKELTKLGCVEIGSSADYLADQEWAGVLEKFNENSETDRYLSLLTAARELLDKYAAVKSGFLTGRRQITEQEFQNENIVKEACAAAEKINELGRQITAGYSEEGRLAAKRASLLPWQSLDVPLDYPSGKYYKVLFGVSPAAGVSPGELVEAAAAGGTADLRLISSDREQNYYLLLLHAGSFDEVMDVLKAKGFSLSSFKDLAGTAGENIRRLDCQLQEVAAQRRELIDKIKALAGQIAPIEQAIDKLTIENRREQLINTLAGTKQTLFIEGWVPKASENEVAKILENQGCAYQFDAPDKDEEPPVLLHNSKFVTPFSMVTELYALPTYNSGLDANPFMAFFFFIFFGLMMGDIGYGIMISLISWLILKKTRPAEGSVMKRLMQLGFLCGLSTIMWGAFFGGFFGDAVKAVSGQMFGREFIIKPILFDPMADPMTLFILSLAFGFIQIGMGMCLSAYKLIKQGQFLDAVFDVGFWLLILGGVPVCLLDLNAGLIMMAVGALGVLCTAGRAKAGFFGKLIGGLGSLYGITGYLSDILSYSRLLALSLATAVIAQVMNTMGTLGGPSVLGWLLFVLVFIVGHIFNVAINILGTYVHTSRLQYIEFFGKFYEPGGRPFSPLFNKTKYVEIIKEGK